MIATLPTEITVPTSDLRAAPRLDATVMRDIRRKAALEGCKWDSQVGDVMTLAPFPLVLKRSVWNQLADWAEQLSVEAASAEYEIAQRPDLLRLLGIPRVLRNVLADDAPLTPAAGRVIRFDFHLTTEGWRISEANSDVPGGFTEASHFTGMMAEHFPGFQTAGDPAEAFVDTLITTTGQSGQIALLTAPGYMEDHQVVSFLASRLRKRGCQTYLAKPEQILWRDSVAWLRSSWYKGPLDAIVKFYQAEWLSRLPKETAWQYFFRGGRTPVANPALAVITESKRFPLVWDELNTPLPTWRMLLPETRAARATAWANDEQWLVKTAMCNTGDTVSIRELMTPAQWFQTRFNVMMSPGKWIAQKRFESMPVSTPVGLRHVCIGVYTVNGQAAGAYARLAEKPLIDFAAVDVALLIEEDE